MRKAILIIFIISSPFCLISQTITRTYSPNNKNNQKESVEIFHHNISVNPLNICFFQQIGVTYEYRLERVGFGITPGFIYPNKMEYSNWFIAGPTNQASLGWYSGWFVVPQVNLYLTKLKYSDQGGVLYLSGKFVYKHMSIDTTVTTVWKMGNDTYPLYRKMFDNVDIYGGFLDIGYRYFIGHFFIDLNFGPGFIWLNHDMTVYATARGPSPYVLHYSDPPVKEISHERTFTINFALNFGAAF